MARRTDINTEIHEHTDTYVNAVRKLAHGSYELLP